MEFRLTPELEAFRAELRHFLADELPPEEERPDYDLIGREDEERAFTVDFQRRLAARGWLAMAWPVEYGGGGASHMHQLVYNEEMSYAGAPVTNMGVAWVGPSLMLYGTDEQKKTFIPRITNVDDLWCTLYSEPGAGSDLASLQTRAVRDGDDWVISGQKIWTSSAHHADWGWLAARTDPGVPKHKGITLFLLDMNSPGVSVRPIYDAANRHTLNEVFFDDVRIPSSRVAGEVNRGWYNLAIALDFERSSIQTSGFGRRAIDRIVDLLKRDQALLKANPGIRADIADRNIEVSVSRLLAYQIASMQTRGEIPNREASISKNFGCELQQRIASTTMRVLGMVGQLRDGSKYQAMDAATLYIRGIPLTIAGGTSEINRSVIATRGIGLSRG